MLRTKLVVLLVVLLGALVAVTLALAAQVRTDLLVEAEEQLKSSNEVVRLAARLNAYSVLVEASEAAVDPLVVRSFACPDAAPSAAADIEGSGGGQPPSALGEAGCADRRHAAVRDALAAWSRRREGARQNNQHRYLSDRDPGFAVPRQPDLLVASTPDGVVVARVGFDKDDWFGESRPNMNQFGAVALTEHGRAGHDLVVWREHPGATPQLARIGAAPVVDDGGERLGAVTVGYFLTDVAAEEAIQLLYGIDVAYFYRTSGDAVSFAGTTAATRPQFLDAVATARFGTTDRDDVTFAELALHRADIVHTFEHDGSEWMAVSTALASDPGAGGVQAGVVVVRSVGEVVAPLARFAATVPLLAVAFLLLGTLGILVAVREFVAPIEDVSRGVQEVIAGNRDYMWEVDDTSHLSDLAHSLNVMSARLQGKTDPDAFEVEGQDDWASIARAAPRSVPRSARAVVPDAAARPSPRDASRSESGEEEP